MLSRLAAASALVAALLAPGVRAGAPAGAWRWESYRDVQIAVPPTWGYAEDWVFFGVCGLRRLPPVVARRLSRHPPGTSVRSSGSRM